MVEQTNFKCSVCKQTKHHKEPHTTGYAVNHLTGQKVCYTCCAKEDKRFMREQGKITLYRTVTNKTIELTNWPGTLSIPVSYQTTGKHNIVGIRYDVWFYFEGKQWHGVQYGDNTQICHCKENKQRR